ncbi:MAG: hypothetical protein KGL99_14330 [Burkholderiales bacterium]|nr:hypothetical protein [Burkholderiales bacterium]MDE2628325.1 hypothetical protein [Burkholderiales bacterium]
MIDRIFSAALTLCLLAGGTLAIGSAMLGLDRPAARAASGHARVVQLKPVVIVGKRLAHATTIARGDATASTDPRAE